MTLANSIAVPCKSEGKLISGRLVRRSPAATMAGRSHVGKVRQENQDKFHIDPDARFALVADGMGGHKGGQIASAIAIETVKSLIEDVLRKMGDISDDVLFLAFQAARAAVEAKALEDSALATMGTTLVMLALGDENEIIAAHLGDSRLYRLRDGKLTPLTRDHNVLAELLHAGILTNEQAELNQRLSHLLTRAISVGCAAPPDIIRVSGQPGDRYLLCSDGLHGVVEDSQIQHLLGDDSPEYEVCEDLVHAALEAGAPDNVTAVMIVVGNRPPTAMGA